MKKFIFMTVTVCLSWIQNSFSQEISVRNATVIPYALESATNISRQETSLKIQYGNIKNTFPKKGELIEVSDTFLLNLFNYGSEFCNFMIESDLKKPLADRWAHASVDFNIPPANWNNQSRLDLFNKYSELFWQRDLTDDEKVIFTEEFTDLLTALPNTNLSGPAALIAVCGIFTVSPGFLFVGGN